MTTPDPGTDVDASTPRRVKVFGVIAIIVLIAFVILHLSDGRPGRHIGPSLRLASS